jgi:hypothetical protein
MRFYVDTDNEISADSSVTFSTLSSDVIDANYYNSNASVLQNNIS